MELRPVGDGYFSIVVRDSEQCLSIYDGSANVVPEIYVGSDDQRWKVESIGGGYYKICAKLSYKCLTVSDDNVEQQQYAGGYSQRWKFEAKDLVTLYEHPDYEGKSKRYQGEVAVPYVEDFNDITSSLKVPAGYTVILYEHPNYGGQSKVFMSDASYVGDDFNDITSSLNVKEIENLGYVKIVNKRSSEYRGCDVVLQGRVVPPIYHIDYSEVNLGHWNGGSDTQRWELKSTGDGYYNIVNEWGNNTSYKECELDGDIQAGDVNEVRLFKREGGNDHRKWKLVSTEDGYYKIVNKWSSAIRDCDVVLDGDIEKSDDDEVQLYEWDDGNDNRRWKLEPAWD
jgi:hypothetical protein